MASALPASPLTVIVPAGAATTEPLPSVTLSPAFSGHVAAAGLQAGRSGNRQIVAAAGRIGHRQT